VEVNSVKQESATVCLRVPWYPREGIVGASNNFKIFISDKRFEVLTVVKMSMLVFWAVTPFVLVAQRRNIAVLPPATLVIYLQVHSALQPRRPTSKMSY
jgi:hypothetical protein